MQRHVLFVLLRIDHVPRRLHDLDQRRRRQTLGREPGGPKDFESAYNAARTLIDEIADRSKALDEAKEALEEGKNALEEGKKALGEANDALDEANEAADDADE